MLKSALYGQTKGAKMCKMASFVVTRTNVLFLKDFDSHEKILQENNILDNTSSPDFVRVEVCPKEGKYDSNFKSWVFNVDQDLLPEWFSEKEAEIAVREALPLWAKYHIIKEGIFVDENYGQKTRIFLGQTKAVIAGQTGGVCEFYGRSTGKVTGQTGGDCYFYVHSKGKVAGQTGGWCWFYDHSKGKVAGQTGGDCYFYVHSKGKVAGQTGGWCWFYDHSNGKVAGQSGGDCRFLDQSKGKVTGQTGGDCRFLDQSTELK